ncbi:MAG: DM13 domain-containing protein [Candidatus Moranbacteria bacterium]|nr:DM13 domain-containing protein [Candidatus Moranbacteria bacterium]
MKKVLIILGLVIVLYLAWYGLSPLFMNTVVNDALPVTNEENTTGEAVKEVPNQIMVGEPDPYDTVPSASVSVVATASHPATGTVRMVKSGGQTIIRYEDYKTINGPDLRVYLSTDLEATKYVDLGAIKGTEGNINYEVPVGIDVSQYRYVLTWCEDFAVLFNSADLSQVQ